MLLLNSYYTSGHQYTVAALGLKKKVDNVFYSREAATRYMHKLCNKFGLHIVEVWDDHHFKTYICSNGVRFFINRF